MYKHWDPTHRSFTYDKMAEVKFNNKDSTPCKIVSTNNTFVALTKEEHEEVVNIVEEDSRIQFQAVAIANT